MRPQSIDDGSSLSSLIARANRIMPIRADHTSPLRKSGGSFKAELHKTFESSASNRLLKFNPAILQSEAKLSDGQNRLLDQVLVSS
jgi:hypothetical protein